MGVVLHIDNRYVTIKGAKRKTIRVLESLTSYKVAGHVFSPAFRNKRWDGREHLMTYSDKRGYRAPIGLAADIIGALEDMGVAYDVDTSARRAPTRIKGFGWNPAGMDGEHDGLRGYQVEAIGAICSCWPPDELIYGSGIMKLPIRSGKTKTEAKIIHDLSVRSLFIVPSQMLLYQTKKSLEESLDCHVGIIGDSIWDESKLVTVATVQTLARARGGKFTCKGNFTEVDLENPPDEVDLKKVKIGTDKIARYWPKDVKRCVCKKKKCKGGREYKVPPTDKYKAMRTAYDLIIFDECHHLRGEIWHKVMMDFDARYRQGLSATAYLDNERENERGVIWLKACCGDIRIDISTSRLIEEGYLMRQHVELHVIRKPENLQDRGWSQSLRNEAILENRYRNKKVVKLAAEKVKQGLKVLIISNRHNQIQALKEIMLKSKATLNYNIVIGTDASKLREAKVKQFTDGICNVLIGTVFGEGIDIPEVECVINAEGGRDVKAAVQRMRNLTIQKGKTEAVFIDFMDMTNSYFAEHSQERLAAYREESAFVINLMK